MASGESRKQQQTNVAKIMLPPDAFKGKIVLVTGGSSGIGAETAIQFTKLGARVAIVGRDKERLVQVAGKCATRPMCLQADLSQDAELECVARTCLERFKGLDVLVNAAGIKTKGGLLTTTLDQYDKIMKINLRAMFYLTHLLTPALIKSKGSIVNVSSTLGERPATDLLAYCISKAGVEKLTQSIAVDLAAKGVRCNSVCPGLIETQMQLSAGMAKLGLREDAQKKQQMQGLERPGKSHEVASAILFLASEASSFVTGTALAVDGGSHIKCTV